MNVFFRNKLSPLSNSAVPCSTISATVTVLVSLLLSALAFRNASAQGWVMLSNFNGQNRTRVYAPLATDPAFSQIGNGSTDVPAGTTSWTGFTLIGADGANGQYGASTTLAALLGAPRLNQPESSLLAGSPLTTFHTGAGAGGMVSAVDAFSNIPYDYTGGGTFEMVVWDNSSGQYPTWALASGAWEAGDIAAGKSGLMNLTAAIGGTLYTPPFLPVQSFDLYYTVIPEPSTFPLLGLGGAALVAVCRRR